MKKLLLVPAVIGLLAVPSVAMAQHSADDTTTHNVRQEDRQNDATKPIVASTATPASTTSQGTTNGQNNEVGDDNGNDDQTAVVPAGSITLDQAKTIALGEFPGKTIQKVETEEEHGVMVYSVRFTDGSRVDVRASDGKVVRSKAKTQTTNNSNSGRSHHGGHDDDNSSSNSGRGSSDD